MIDYSKLHNPYDFANPVGDTDLFIGRKEELEQLNYYLDHAKTAPRSINIAILGLRASGKTSLLNITEHEARKRDFCTVRIDLDEGDLNSQLLFFYKLFDSILTSVCEINGFGGKNGKTYETYLEIVNGFIIPDDKTFCPFIFPLQYALLMKNGYYNNPISDHNFKQDLIKLQSEINQPIVLLFDEGNILANSRVLLEKIRNIFMNISGYMLIITGTPDLFPVMDDVFSPIIRQFKKIQVREFKEEEDTKDCIRKPLEKIGITPEKIFDFETYKEVEEIHELSGGKPYEIQLICHMLFKRVQTKRAKKMKLDLTVLEDVRKELETSQDISTRPILTKVRYMSELQLSALEQLSISNGHANFDELWSGEYIFNGNKKWTKEELKKEFVDLLDMDVVKEENDILKFAGDDFDKIYTKYFAREKGIVLNFVSLPLDVFFGIKIHEWIRNIKGIIMFSPMNLVEPLDTSFSLENIVAKLGDNELKIDIFAEEAIVTNELYKLMMDNKNNSSVSLIRITLQIHNLNMQFLYIAKNKNVLEPLDLVIEQAKDVVLRAEELGAKLNIEKLKFPVINNSVIIRNVVNTVNERMKDVIVDYHSRKIVEEYAENKNLDEAIFHANLVCQYKEEINYYDYNNIAYLYMKKGDYILADKYLQKSIETAIKPSAQALAYYNYGILKIYQGNDLKDALKYFGLCLNVIEEVIGEEDRMCSCLLIPKKSSSSLEISEEFGELNLLKVCLQVFNDVAELCSGSIDDTNVVYIESKR